jgi:hypothetical protein
MFGGFAALRSHAGLDDNLWRFSHDVFIRQVEPGLGSRACNIFTASESNKLVNEILSSDDDQRPKPHCQKS